MHANQPQKKYSCYGLKKFPQLENSPLPPPPPSHNFSNGSSLNYNLGRGESQAIFITMMYSCTSKSR